MSKKIKQKKFCRIIDLPETQVLLVLRYDDEDDMYKVDITMEFEDTSSTFSLGFNGEDNGEDKAKKCLEEYSIESAKKMYISQKELIE